MLPVGGTAFSDFPWLSNPFSTPLRRLELVLRGIKKLKEAAVRPGRLPVTPEVLKIFRHHWSPRASDFDVVMLWRACCLGFFAFLRADEFTVPSRAAYDLSVYLSVEDVAIDSRAAPSIIRLRLKQSKTDPFQQDVDIHLGKTESDLCPVTAVLAYLAIRRSAPAPPFLFRDCATLSRGRLISKVRGALAASSHDPSRYSGHSFRIGAAAAAASRSLEDSTIQTLGIWRSDAYKRYLKLDKNTLAGFSKCFAANKQ